MQEEQNISLIGIFVIHIHIIFIDIAIVMIFRVLIVTTLVMIFGFPVVIVAAVNRRC